jgi:hypothetical protein
MRGSEGEVLLEDQVEGLLVRGIASYRVFEEGIRDTLVDHGTS